MGLLDLADRSWPVLRRLFDLHTVVYRATGGLLGHDAPGAPPVLLLDHVGARSGFCGSPRPVLSLSRATTLRGLAWSWVRFAAREGTVPAAFWRSTALG